MVCEALLMAINNVGTDKSLICHSYQGSEYATNKYRKLLINNNIRQSLSRKGHCWDNAFIESFFHSLKTEMVYFKKFNTFVQAMAYIWDYIHFYNNERLHSGLGYKTPKEYGRLKA